MNLKTSEIRTMTLKHGETGLEDDRRRAARVVALLLNHRPNEVQEYFHQNERD